MSDQSVIKELEQDAAKLHNHKLSLADAMRKGAKLRPQVFGAFFSRGGSCAVGAAIEGRFGYTELSAGALIDAAQEWPELNRQVTCPTTGHTTILMEAICSMNNAQWTRERIADWIDQNVPQAA